jgi:threonine dehydratase
MPARAAAGPARDRSMLGYIKADHGRATPASGAVAPPVTLAEVLRAAALCRGRASVTPLEEIPGLCAAPGHDIRLKLECFQRTGSFKIRGALAALAGRHGRDEIVITASAGNHALAMAAAASEIGVRARIHVPASADPAKLARLRRFGEPVEIVVVDGSYDDSERAARAAAAGTAGARFVSSYNDPDVIAGQGTIALELLEQWPEVEAVVVPVGGGGLISGVGLAIKSAAPWVRVVGAEPAASCALARSLAAGRVVRIPEGGHSIADCLVGNLDPESITVPLARRYADEIVLVDEDDIRTAVKRLYEVVALVVEPSGAAALAALGSARSLAGLQRIACVVTGRNVAAATHRAAIGLSARPE